MQRRICDVVCVMRWGILVFNYNKMRRVKVQRKEEEICAWGVQKDAEGDTHFMPRTKRKKLLPDIAFTNKYPSTDLREMPTKLRRAKLNPQEGNARRLKSQSFDSNLPLPKDSRGKGQPFPSLPTLPSLIKKISKSEPANLQQKQAPNSHANHNKSFIKYDQMSNHFNFKLLHKKLSQIQSSSKELQSHQALKRRGSQQTLKVKTIQMLIKQEEAPPQQRRVGRKSPPKGESPHRQKLQLIEQAKQSGELQFSDGGIFLQHPILYTSIYSPVQFKGESKTDRYRIIIK